MKPLTNETKYKKILKLLRLNFDHTSMLLGDDKLYGKGEATVKCEMIAKLIVNDIL